MDNLFIYVRDQFIYLCTWMYDVINGFVYYVGSCIVHYILTCTIPLPPLLFHTEWQAQSWPLKRSIVFTFKRINLKTLPPLSPSSPSSPWSAQPHIKKSRCTCLDVKEPVTYGQTAWRTDTFSCFFFFCCLCRWSKAKKVWRSRQWEGSLVSVTWGSVCASV